MTKGYGISPDDIGWSCPADLQPYTEAYRIEQERDMKEADMQNWYLGQYFASSLMATVGNMLRGKHGRANEYVKKPFFDALGDDYGLTQEEMDERELKKMVAWEDAWCRQLKGRLPETKIE